MDDRAAHFFTLVASVCEAARLADLPVRLRLQDGSDLEGHPLPAPHAEERELDDTGYVDGIDIGNKRVALSDVVAIEVRRRPD